MNIRTFTVLPVLAAVVLALTGCATIVEGGDQNIYFNTDPEGATCTISREGVVLYDKITTPATLEIEKDKDVLFIRCEKDGYKTAEVGTDSTFEGMALGNLIIGGIIGVGIDAATGAINEYPDQIILRLEEE